MSDSIGTENKRIFEIWMTLYKPYNVAKYADRFVLDMTFLSDRSPVKNFLMCNRFMIRFFENDYVPKENIAKKLYKEQQIKSLHTILDDTDEWMFLNFAHSTKYSTE